MLTLDNNSTDLFAGGYLGGATVMDIDLSQPRNVINYYPYFAKSIGNTFGNPRDSAASATARPARTNLHTLRAAAT